MCSPANSNARVRVPHSTHDWWRLLTLCDRHFINIFYHRLWTKCSIVPSHQATFLTIVIEDRLQLAALRKSLGLSTHAAAVGHTLPKTHDSNFCTVTRWIKNTEWRNSLGAIRNVLIGISSFNHESTSTPISTTMMLEWSKETSSGCNSGRRSSWKLSSLKHWESCALVRSHPTLRQRWIPST